MAADDLITIADHWSRSLSPPRALLARLLDLVREADAGITDLRLLQHDNDIVTPIAAAVSPETDALHLEEYPALSKALNERRVAFNAPDRWYFPAVADLARTPGHLLEVFGQGALTPEALHHIQYAARMVAQALELRELRVMSGFNRSLAAHSENVQEAISTRLTSTLTSLVSARDLTQMAAILARDLLTGREVLTLNVIDYDPSGGITGWQAVSDNSGLDNPRRSDLRLPWVRLGEPLRDAILNGEPFILDALGPEEKEIIGAPLLEWLQVNGIASIAFFPISQAARTTAALGLLSTEPRQLSEAAIHSFVKLAERMALLTIHKQRMSEVTVRQFWATQLQRTSQQLFKASRFSEVTLAAIDALPPSVTLTALALFDVPVHFGGWPDWVRVEALSSRVESRELPFNDYDRLDSANRAARDVMKRLSSGQPALEMLQTGLLGKFAESLVHGLLERGARAAAYIGLCDADMLYGVLVAAAPTLDVLKPLGNVLHDLGTAVGQAVKRLMTAEREAKPNDLSRVLRLSQDLLHAMSEQEMMRAVRRCLSGDFATVVWVDVVVNRVTQRISEYVINSVLREGEFDVLALPLHERMDEEQNLWFHRTWLSKRNRGQVVYYESAADMSNDVALPEVVRPGQDTFYSAVVLPVIVDETLVAQVYVAFQSAAHEPTAEFHQLCQLVRDQLSLKVKTMKDPNASSSKHDVPVLQVVNDLAIRLLTVRDERTLLTEGARAFANALGVDHAGVTILRGDGAAEVVAEFPDANLVGIIIPPDNPYLIETVRDRNPLIVEDAPNDPKLTPENRAGLAESGIKKMLFLPMLDENQVCFGSIGLDIMRDEYEFDLPIVEVARTLTNQLAMLYLSLRQFRAARRQAQQLEAMTRLSSDLVAASRDDELFHAVADQVQSILAADELWVLMDTGWLQGRSEWPPVGELNDSEDVQVVMQFEGGRPYKPREPITYILEDTPAGRARNGDLVYVADIQAEQGLRPLMVNRPARSVLAAPILVNDRVVGVIEIDSVVPHAYTDADVQIFAQLASQISGALARARNLQAVQRAAKTQEATARFGAHIQAAGSQRSTMIEAARGYQDFLGAKQVNIQLGQPPESEDADDGAGNEGANGAKGEQR